MIARVDDSTDEDLIEESLCASLTQVFRHGVACWIEHVVFGYDDTSCGLGLKRDRIACLLTRLTLLVVIRVDPNIGDVVIEDFSDFVNDSSCQLWRDFSRGDPAADSFNLALLRQIHSFELASVHLFDSDDASSQGCKASFDHFDGGAGRAELVQDEVEGA